jgi:hypothetical protein
VVPEVDLPGHATALLPLMSPAGVQFCTEYNASIGVLPSQVYDDEGGRSFHVIRTLLLEIFPLYVAARIERYETVWV